MLKCFNLQVQAVTGRDQRPEGVFQFSRSIWSADGHRRSFPR